MLLDRVGVFAGAFARLDGEELALIVPLIERRVLIQALVDCRRISSAPCTAASAFATSVLPTPALPSSSSGLPRKSIIQSAVAKSRSAM